MVDDPGRTEALQIVRTLGAHALGSAERKDMEARLVALYQSSPASRDTVVRAFRPLALNLAARYFRHREPLADLEQVACVGLIQALRRFDVTRESPFVAFAIPTISGELRRHYRDTGWAVHVTRGAQEAAQKVMTLERDANQSLTPAEAATRLGISAEEVVEGRIAARAMLADSLDAPAPGGDDDDRPRHDAGSSVDDGYSGAEDRAWLNALMREVPEREREIVRLRFHEDLTQAEIGERLGVSQMHVSRLLRRTLDRMRLTADTQAS